MLCDFDLAGLHVRVEHVYYTWPADVQDSFVASVWQIERGIGTGSGYRYTLGQKSFGSQQAADNWILKQLMQSTFVLLAGRTIE